MSKFTAAELVEFYQKVADGGEMECVREDDSYMISHYGPHLGSLTDQWRIKPAKKIIDMAHFIKSGIDMEFSNCPHFKCRATSPLKTLGVRAKTNYMATTNINATPYVRPRMKHIHFHNGGACPLPEGFKVRLMFRDGAAVVTHTYSDLKWVSSEFKVFTHADIIGYEILGLADGWTYPWEYVDED